MGDHAYCIDMVPRVASLYNSVFALLLRCIEFDPYMAEHLRD